MTAIPPNPLEPTRKTLVVHSGTYKTGSSAIQLYLFRADQAGLLGDAHFPTIGRSFSRQHLNLNAELRGGKMFDPRMGSWDDLLADFLSTDTSTCVVSSENFSTLAEDQIRVIGDKARAAGIQVRWVHYLREQSSFYNAFYVERLVNMRPEFLDVIDLPFEEFGTWSPIDMSFLNYGSFAESLLRAIPDVDLVLRPFSRQHLLDGDAVADFCAAAGLPLAAEHASIANIGTGWRTVETARRMTPLVGAAEIGRRSKIYQNPTAARLRWIGLVRTELVRATAAAGWNKESAVYLTPEFRDVLRERYRAENERVTSLAGFDWAAIADAEPNKDYNIGDYSTIPGDEVLAVVERVTRPLITKPDEIKAMPHKPRPAVSTPSLTRRAVNYARRRVQRNA